MERFSSTQETQGAAGGISVVGLGLTLARKLKRRLTAGWDFVRGREARDEFREHGFHDFRSAHFERRK